MAISMALPPPVVLLEVELFLNSRRGELKNGISERFIPSQVNQTEVFLMARCCSVVRVISTEPLITAGPIILVLFTSCIRALAGNGQRGYSIASKAEETVVARSAILFLITSAISTGLRVRAVQATVRSLS